MYNMILKYITEIYYLNILLNFSNYFQSPFSLSLLGELELYMIRRREIFPEICKLIKLLK